MTTWDLTERERQIVVEMMRYAWAHGVPATLDYPSVHNAFGKLAGPEAEAPEPIRLHGNGLRHLWKPGERVEYQQGYDPPATRLGVVVGVDGELRRHEFLRVRFDDGEERRINPDVMRHVR